jgi:hypothetical protein
MRALAVLCLSLAAAAPASAQSLYGPGGLFLHPSASLPEPGRLTPAILVLPQRNPTSDAVRTWFSTSLDYGVTKQIEIGLTYLEVFNWKDRASFGGYMKFKLLEESDGRPAIAAGFSQLAFGDFDASLVFLAGQKELFSIRDRFPVTAHLGGMYVDELDGIARSAFVPYGGVEIGLNDYFSFIAEGRTKMKGDESTPWGLTVVYKPNEDWKFALTWSNTGQSGSPRFGFGAGLALGARR